MAFIRSTDVIKNLLFWFSKWKFPLQEESKWLGSGSDDADMGESEECNEDENNEDDSIIESASPIQEPEGIDEGYIFCFPYQVCLWMWRMWGHACTYPKQTRYIWMQ